MKPEFSIKTLLEGFFNAFNAHKGLIPTIKDLALKPKNVIDFYTDGKTDTYGYNKYFSPGRFFVTVLAILSVLTFLATESDIATAVVYLSSKASSMITGTSLIITKPKSLILSSIN